MKTLAKKALVSLASRFGQYVPTRQSRRFFFERVVPHLLDPAILPHGLAERPAKHFGIDLLCDPYIYVHRNGYWCGIFYEEEMENYLLREIRAGDTVIDVGMNVGHVALPAAKLVGSGGKVFAFEPNTGLTQLVRSLADKQALRQLEIVPCGLGNTDCDLELRMDLDHSGGATFRQEPVFENQAHAIKCSVKRGDSVLSGRELPGRVFLKMDVEGFEVQALEGLWNTLDKVDHAIIEVTPEWLGIEGVTRLFDILHGKMLLAHRINVDGTVGRRVQPADIRGQVNVVFRRASVPRSVLSRPLHTGQH